MLLFTHKILSSGGLHARSCVQLASLAQKGTSRISVNYACKTSDCRDPFSLMDLNAVQHSFLTFQLEGPDEAEMKSRLSAFCQQYL